MSHTKNKNIKYIACILLITGISIKYSYSQNKLFLKTINIINEISNKINYDYDLENNLEDNMSILEIKSKPLFYYTKGYYELKMGDKNNLAYEWFYKSNDSINKIKVKEKSIALFFINNHLNPPSYELRNIEYNKYKDIINEATTEKLNNFINNYKHPDNPYMPNCKYKLDSLIYSKYININTITGYNEYLIRSKYRLFSEDVENRKKNIYKLEFERAKEEKTSKALHNFILKYPDWNNLDSVKYMYDSILWNETKLINTLEKYKDYKAKSYKSIRNAITECEDSIDNHVFYLSKNNYNTLIEYIKTFPKGNNIIKVIDIIIKEYIYNGLNSEDIRSFISALDQDYIDTRIDEIKSYHDKILLNNIYMKPTIYNCNYYLSYNFTKTHLDSVKNKLYNLYIESFNMLSNLENYYKLIKANPNLEDSIEKVYKILYPYKDVSGLRNRPYKYNNYEMFEIGNNYGPSRETKSYEYTCEGHIHEYYLNGHFGFMTNKVDYPYMKCIKNIYTDFYIFACPIDYYSFDYVNLTYLGNGIEYERHTETEGYSSFPYKDNYNKMQFIYFVAFVDLESEHPIKIVRPLGSEYEYFQTEFLIGPNLHRKYPETIIKNKIDNKYKLETLSGQVISERSFDNIEYLTFEDDGYIKEYILFYEDNKIGLLDMSGNVIFPAVYSKIGFSPNYFHNGYQIVEYKSPDNTIINHIKKDGNLEPSYVSYGLIDKKYNIILDAIYSNIEYDTKSGKDIVKLTAYSNVLYSLHNIPLNKRKPREYNNQLSTYFYNLKSKIIISDEYSEIIGVYSLYSDVSKYYYAVIYPGSNYICFIDNKYNLVTGPSAQIHDLERGKITFGNFLGDDFSIVAFVTYNNKYYVRAIVYLHKNKVVILEPPSISLRYKGSFRYYGDLINGFIPFGEGGKYGFIDKNGRDVIPAIYDEPSVFWGNQAQVKLNGISFNIDKNGNKIK
jgi:hypothetical protein